ncbi:MAG: radical SAM family heme chaperone HemW [Flavobacteriales bacterium]|nr:radical SAM family heme chaperone HemW [Flavobacteriales bacterium]MCB9449339.1 radical SAM family heme chaperone HemW [Flavobacteriales bacterium]
MAGIYIHIPFCRQACYYCDFHFSTQQKYRSEMIHALQGEMAMRSEELKEKTMQTVYLGGGTPSILASGELASVMNSVRYHWQVSPDAEITLEVNPEDVTPDSLKTWRQAGINRLSMGVQSFRDEDLRMMNRSHSTASALASLEMARDAGFADVNMDLIYGIPGLDDVAWEANIEQFIGLDLPHLSAYSLTIEPKTVFHHRVHTGAMQLPDEEKAIRQYMLLMNRMESAGYEAYEISNFARSGKMARHNTGYWQGMEYLGIGPSAHSFINGVRSWNVSNNASYIKSIRDGQRPSTEEILSESDRYNEYVMTGLRTVWGCEVDEIKNKFGSMYSEFFQEELKNINPEYYANVQGHVSLTLAGKCFADRIASQLFWVN